MRIDRENTDVRIISFASSTGFLNIDWSNNTRFMDGIREILSRYIVD